MAGRTGASARSCSRMTAPLTTPGIDTEDDVAFDHPWKVIVWDDPINLMSYVTFVFRKVFGYSKNKAEQLMMQVHVEGRAIVSSGTREKAELDVFRLHEHGLWATLEQDP
ncbi:MAG: ATP-dependent Clp protease adapter ClpS [Acidimicrobiaceae bacterium]|nr:ATP-dependent Clp protease adapter ClpS [Acidimicrobiaceae bacterium]